jgi:hypothetical protein
MKCRICASECPPGARICGDCVAARKRAFAATVTQPLLAAVGAPSVSQLRFAPRPAKRRLVSRLASSATRSETPVAASAGDRGAAPGRISVKWLLLGVAMATTIVFVVIRILASGHAADNAEIAPDAAGGTTALLAPHDAAPAIAAPAIAAPQETAQNQPVAEGAGVAPPDAETDARVAPKNTVPKVVGRKVVVGKVEAAKGAPAEPSPVAKKTESVAAAPRNGSARVAEAPRDPWQAMNEGLSRCAREDFLSRFACEQRLRQQYCPNYWGLVPQCAIGRTTDHGQ